VTDARVFRGKVTDYADGDRKVIDCGEQEVGIFKIDGEFFAWYNRCAAPGRFARAAS
jgi:nitrite reductase/ring-hydroxylating ferredoxin subunit